MTTQAILQNEIDALRERVVGLENQLARQEQTVLALQENEARLHSVLNNLLDAPYRRNLRTDRYDYLSPVIEQLTGWTVEEMNQADIETVLNWIHPDDLPQVQQEIERTNALCRETGRATGTLEYRFRTRAGDYCWLDDHLTVIAGDDGQPLYRLGGVRDITERQQVEEMLRQNDEKYSQLFNQAVFPIALFQLPAGVFVDANEAFEETFGYSRQEIVGKTSVELGLTTPETRASIMEKVQQGLLPGYEWQMRTKSGEVRVVLINTGVVEFGGQKHVVTTFQDITERKQAEEQRARLTERLELATRVAEMGIWDWDIPGNRLVWDEQMYALYGRQPHEFAGAYEAWLQGVHPADRAASDAASEQARRGESDYNTEFRVVWPDGSIRWLHATGQVFFDAADQAVRMIGVNYNITARKQTEEKLRQSEAQMNTIFEASPIAIGLSRLSDGQITHINTAFENLYGYARAEIVGRTTAELNIWEAPADRQRFIELLKAEGACMLETIARLKSGDNRHVLVSGRVVTINGEPYAMAQIVDISQRKHMEDELRRSNAELEQFAYVASHDLQEPLRAVAGMMQLLQQRYHGRLDEYADEYIELAVEAANRMQALINDLLTYSRVGRRGKSFEPVNAGSCLETALQNLKVAIAENQAVITYDNLPTVTADSTQLTQLFQNLIGNSLKFRSDQPPQIHISAVKTAARWQFSVRDNGIGIEPQYFERIFQVFQRLHTRDEYPGTGIGLALCQKIVERHNGAIWVESQGGKAQPFILLYP